MEEIHRITIERQDKAIENVFVRAAGRAALLSPGQDGEMPQVEMTDLDVLIREASKVQQRKRYGVPPPEDPLDVSRQEYVEGIPWGD